MGDGKNKWDDGSWDDEDVDDEPIDAEIVSVEEDIPSSLEVRSKNLDRRVDRAVDRFNRTARDTRQKAKAYIPIIRRRAKDIYVTAEETKKSLDQMGDQYTERIRKVSPFEAILRAIVKHPKKIIVSCLIFSLIFGMYGVVIRDMQSNIRADFNVYLPQDDPTKKILDDVQEDWSTDIVILMVETPNAWDKTQDEDSNNITNRTVLLEISAIEEAIDYNKTDQGLEDGVVFVLSISTIIKTINNTPEELSSAIIEELVPGGGGGNVVNDGSSYAIPDQETIDALMKRVPENQVSQILADTNDDELYDSAAVLIGLRPTNDGRTVEDIFENIVGDADRGITGMIALHYIDADDEDGYTSRKKVMERIENGEIHCTMSPTGPVAITKSLTDRTYDEMMRVLPLALLCVGGMLLLFHRNWRILLITFMPIGCSLLITFGLLGATGMVLTPQVTMVAPVLVALGVAYGLYIANRYSDERDIEEPEERVIVAVKTTGKAIFLSAITTAFGFGSLMTINMLPMRVLGFGLAFGILMCYVMTILIAPGLIIWLNYEKRTPARGKFLARVPENNRKKILAVAMAVTIFSLVLITVVEANMNFIDMSPQDEEPVRIQNKYTENFGGGQLGMILLEANPVVDNVTERTFKDYSKLFSIKQMEDEINENFPGDENSVPYTTGISIVDIMDMIAVPSINESNLELLSFISEEFPIVGQYVDIFINNIEGKSFWDALTWLEDTAYAEPFQHFLIDVFYETLHIEMRLMLVTEDYSRSLIYIDMPSSLDVIETEKAVVEVNDICRSRTDLISSDLTGFAAVLVALNNMLVRNSLISTFMALALVMVVLSVIFRSPKYAGLTLIPVTLVVAWQPLTLKIVEVAGKVFEQPFTGDLNLFSALIGSVVIGLGIDFGIHMTERIRESGMDLKGIAHGVATSGWSFFEATLTMMAGFIAVLFIPVPAIREFIFIIIFLLAFSMIGALFVLPAIYCVLAHSKLEKEAEERYSDEDESLEVKPF